MKMVPRLTLAVALAVVATGVSVSRGAEPGGGLTTRNVVLVTTDGLRWQDVFRGADEALINKPDGGVADVEGLRKTFWREGVEARREALMPFFWTTIARQGQVFGNADKGSPARVTNGKNFSYPGYNELLTGAADDRIDSNDKKHNPNVSVLEWLNGKPAYRGKVSAVGSWDLFPYILNVPRSGLPVNAGWEPLAGGSFSESQHLLNDLINRSPRLWDNCRHDALTFPLALEVLKRDQPRVLYVSFGDTDEFAHAGRYDRYLTSAHNFDADLKRLWETLQALPQYRGTTSLVVTTDHGRGNPPRDWRNHGASIAGADGIWVAVLGPDTPALGERKETGGVVTQSQIAATVAALLGEDFRADAKKAAPPISDAIRRASQPAAAQ